MGCYEGGGMRYFCFRAWLEELHDSSMRFMLYTLEEGVRRYLGVRMLLIIYGGFLAHLTAWCKRKTFLYQGIPVGVIKRSLTGDKGMWIGLP